MRKFSGLAQIRGCATANRNHLQEVRLINETRWCQRRVFLLFVLHVLTLIRGHAASDFAGEKFGFVLRSRRASVERIYTINEPLDLKANCVQPIRVGEALELLVFFEKGNQQAALSESVFDSAAVESA